MKRFGQKLYALKRADGRHWSDIKKSSLMIFNEEKIKNYKNGLKLNKKDIPCKHQLYYYSKSIPFHNNNEKINALEKNEQKPLLNDEQQFEDGNEMQPNYVVTIDLKELDKYEAPFILEDTLLHIPISDSEGIIEYNKKLLDHYKINRVRNLKRGRLKENDIDKDLEVIVHIFNRLEKKGANNVVQVEYFCKEFEAKRMIELKNHLNDNNIDILIQRKILKQSFDSLFKKNEDKWVKEFKGLRDEAIEAYMIMHPTIQQLIPS